MKYYFNASTFNIQHVTLLQTRALTLRPHQENYLYVFCGEREEGEGGRQGRTGCEDIRQKACG